MSKLPKPDKKSIIFEDDNVYACLAKYPITKGHTVVVSKKEFDKLCKEKGIPHYFIYPRTPKQNSYVEISHEALG